MWILSISFFISFLLQAKPSPLTNKSKDALGRDFVRPSTSILPVGVRTRVIAPASTYSLMAWYLIGMCLDCLPVTGLRAKSTAPLLSQCMGIGEDTSYPNSSMNDLYHMAWFEASARLMYSASVVDCATVFCFCEHQEMAALARRKT